jgi:peptidoglycan/xylan/chitin deacetylase (PgdA/CDA1 family)
VRVEQTPIPYGDLRPLVGPFARPVVQISGLPAEVLERAARGLPDGAAKAEAVAVRLRRAGVKLDWGAPHVATDVASLVRLQRARGASSVEMVRADPSLLTEMQVGAYFDAYWRRRIIRQGLCRLGVPRSGKWTHSMLAAIASDAAFWLGVRSTASDHEWERLVRSSYVVFYYHRIAGERKAGYERMDVHPRRFESQLRLLRILGFRPLSAGELLAFHSDANATIPGRRYVLAADDAFADAVAVLRRHAHLHPHVFVCTSLVGAEAWWADNEPIASWEELQELARAGGVIESHSRGHTRLPELDQQALEADLTGSLRDLEAHLSPRSGLLAYPHGSHDERVRAATIEAGYRAAFTTEPGRNGAGTDVYCLRRIGLKDWDGPLSLAWKALTGEFLPWFWERRTRRLRAAASRRASRSHRRTAER